MGRSLVVFIASDLLHSSINRRQYDTAGLISSRVLATYATYTVVPTGRSKSH